ncbi:uroporphyrinogen-III synthase [Cellulosimicrobium funkei]|nr:uroporphyrinogen-III synthase [Cellulosimicrobium funkei]
MATESHDVALSGVRTVVMTRQPEQSGAVEAGLAAAGHRVAYLPLTDFELPEDTGPLRAAVARLSGRPTPRPTLRPEPDGGAPAGAQADARVGWLVLTSPNSVRALVLLGWDGGVAAGVRVAVTGPGTARVLTAAGYAGAPWMPGSDASAAGILEQFPHPGRTVARTVLLPQSSLATDEVAAGLAARGWDVERIEAYRTVPYPAESGRRLLAGAGGHGGGGAVPGTAAGTVEPGPAVVTVEDLAGADVVLTSPSAVAELVRRRGTARPEGTRFLAIGRPTALAAHAAGLTLAGTAPSPDAAGLLAVLTA